MRRSWSFTAYAIAIIAMLLLTACGGSSGGTATTTGSSTGKLDASKKYTVNFWEALATGANKTSLETLTKQYMQLHSNVNIVLQAYDSYDTLKTKLTAAIAAGKPPAMAQVYETWATQYQQSDAIVPLNSFISGKNGLSQTDLSDFYPSLLKDGQINGTQYMMPFNKSDMVLYYNVDALQKLGIQPPTTFSDLEADITKVTKSDGSQWGLSLTPSSDEWDIMYKAFGGKDFVSTDGKSVGFASGDSAKAAKQALGELAPLVKSGAIHVTKGYDWQNDFASQKSVFALSTVASYPFIKSAVNGAFQFTEAPVPAGPSGQFTVLYGTNLSIFSKTDADTQVAAWDYIKYLTSTTATTTLVKLSGYVPLRQSAFNSSDLQSYYAKTPARKAGPQSLNFAFVDSIVPAWSQCRDIITTDFTSTLKGQSTADDAFAKLTQSCNNSLSQG